MAGGKVSFCTCARVAPLLLGVGRQLKGAGATGEPWSGREGNGLRKGQGRIGQASYAPGATLTLQPLFLRPRAALFSVKHHLVVVLLPGSAWVKEDPREVVSLLL